MFKWKGKDPKRKNLLGHALKVMQSSIKIDFDFDAYAKRHLFNYMSRNSEYGLYYYPFGYLFRYPKWGTINEMGFRCKENTYEVRKVYPDRIIAAVFGGSTGFDILVPDQDTFANQIEVMLNQDEELMALTGKKFKVANLAHPGNVLLNQIFNYVLFCRRLSPDIVISHYGVNDFCSGQSTDSTFMKHYGICYADVLDTWGRKIHDADDVVLDYDFSDAISPDFKPVEARNSPHDLVRACHERVTQFEEIVRPSGALFIAGFQPWLTSKKKLSPIEEAAVKTYNPYYVHIYHNNATVLWDMYDEHLRKHPLPYVVNLHQIFKKYGEEVTLFGDVCHLLAPGDKIVAEAYASRIRAAYRDGRAAVKKETYETTHKGV